MTQRPTRRPFGKWWSVWPDADIGIATGDGLVVIDVDPRHDGITLLCGIEDKYGELPTTRTVRTGGGGLHHYFRTSKDVRSRKISGNGLELTSGGYVVAPPSIHAECGKAYEWQDAEADIVALPEWLENAEERSTATAQRIDMAAVLEGVSEGQRNDSLFRATCRLRAADVPEVFALALILGAAEVCLPPLPEVEARQIVERVYATYPPGLENAYRGTTPEYVVGSEPTPRASDKLVQASSIEPVEVSWLWRQRIPLGKVTLLDGDPGIGKSTVMMDLAARVTTGREMPDGSPSDGYGPGTVLLLSAEDGIDDTIVPRLIAAEGNRELLWIWPNDHMPEIPGSVQEIGTYVGSYGIRLVIIDPLMAYLAQSVKANDDHHVRRALAPLLSMAAATGCGLSCCVT